MAPVGFVYHTGMALKSIIWSCIKNNPQAALDKRLAWQHAKAASNDLLGFPVARTPFFGEPNRSVMEYISSTEVYIPNPTDDGLGLSYNGPAFDQNRSHIQAKFDQHLYRTDELYHSVIEIRENRNTILSLTDRSVIEWLKVRVNRGQYGVIRP